MPAEEVAEFLKIGMRVKYLVIVAELINDIGDESGVSKICGCEENVS